MNFSINIECDNAAFEDGDRNFEIARILREIANQIEAGDVGKARDIWDSNGNIVGQFELKQERA